MINAEVLNKNSNLVMPSSYNELDREEMCYIEAGFFIGIEVSSAVAVSFFNLCSNAMIKYGCGVPGVLAIIKTIPAANALLGKIVSLLTEALSVVPLWGKVIAGVIIGSLAAATIYAGSQGYGFKIGLEIGWFNIKGVCEYI